MGTSLLLNANPMSRPNERTAESRNGHWLEEYKKVQYHLEYKITQYHDNVKLKIKSPKPVGKIY